MNHLNRPNEAKRSLLAGVEGFSATQHKGLIRAILSMENSTCGEGREVSKEQDSGGLKLWVHIRAMWISALLQWEAIS